MLANITDGSGDVMREQPCKKDCPRRSAGCGSTCEEWQKYVKKRNAEYEERREMWEKNNMIFEGKVKFIRHNFVHRRK